MPPDVVRPFAFSTVGDIIAIAHRLGMDWKDLRPAEGIMRAEGSGENISSTSVRSLGILLQYTSDLPLTIGKLPADNAGTVPTANADKFGFSIIPGFSSLDMLEIRLGDGPGGKSEREVIITALRYLEIEDSIKHIDEYETNIQSFYDLIPLTAPWIPLPDSTIVQIRRPCKLYGSPLAWWEGFVTFHQRLVELCTYNSIDVTSQMQWVLDQFQKLQESYPYDNVPSWENEIGHNKVKNGRDPAFLNIMHSLWKLCTAYLMNIQAKYPGRVFYRNLVAAHLAEALHCPGDAEENVGDGSDAGGRWFNGYHKSSVMAETMHLYIDCIPNIAYRMATKFGYQEHDVVRDAWWTMILRAFCWNRSIAYVDRSASSTVVPSALYDSKMPVYLA